MTERAAMPWQVLPGLASLVELVFVAALAIAWMGDDKTLLTAMCTAAVTQAMLAMGYFFGSSAGSAKKDATIAASTAALGTSAPTTTTITSPSTSSAEAATTTTTTQP